MNIKIAIPTNDRLNISSDMFRCEFFKIIEVKCGKIIGEDFLENTFFKSAKDKEDVALDFINNLLFDCDFIITSTLSNNVKNYFMSRGKKIVLTSENLISNITHSFICELARKESDTICSP